MTSSLAKTLKLVLLSSVVALGAARPADAAYVVINADPLYGAQFAGVGWRAVGALYISDQCVAAATAINALTPGQTTIFNPLTVYTGIAGYLPPPSICADSRIQDVQLQFYNASTGAVLDTLLVGTYTPDQPPPNLSHNRLDQELIDFTFKDGQLTGFDTTLSKTLYSDVLIAADGKKKCFALELSTKSVRGGARVESYDSDPSASNGCTTTLNPRDPGEASNPLYTPTVTFGSFITGAYVKPGFTPLAIQVPEPASLALSGLALLALAAVRRRRVS